MPYGQNYAGYGGGFQSEGGGFAGGLASGLDNLVKFAAQRKLENAQAQRETAMTAWAQNPNNPENQLKASQAAYFKSKGQPLSVADVYGYLHQPVPQGVDPNAMLSPQYANTIMNNTSKGNISTGKNTTAVDVANIRKDATLGAGGGVGRGMASLIKGVLNSQEQSRVDTLPGALAIHNNLVDVWQAANKANGDAGVTTRLLQSMAAKNPALSGYAQEIGADPSKLAAVYNTMVRQAAGEQYKLVNGSNAAPSEDAIAHNAASYPTLMDSPDVAAAKFNTLNETQIRPSMMGPIGRLETFKNPQTGAYPAALYQTVHDNLTNQLSSFDTKVKGLQGFSQGTGGDMNVPLMNGGAQPTATTGESIAPPATSQAIQHPPDIMAAAQAAMNDSSASPEIRAKAQSILGK